MSDVLTELAFETPEPDSINGRVSVLLDLNHEAQTAWHRFDSYCNELFNALGEMNKRGDLSLETVNDLIRFFYWDFTTLTGYELSTTYIEKAFGVSNNHVSRRAGGSTVHVLCTSWNLTFPFAVKSRVHKMEVMTKKGAHKCPACINLTARAEQEKRQKADAQRKRLEQLKTMRYDEYLKTDEWQWRRKKKLEDAGYHCQLCHANGGILDVHHSTYERKGNENLSDLIVLCRDCHSKFHGKEAQQ